MSGATASGDRAAARAAFLRILESSEDSRALAQAATGLARLSGVQLPGPEGPPDPMADLEVVGEARAALSSRRFGRWCTAVGMLDEDAAVELGRVFAVDVPAAAELLEELRRS